MATVPYTGEGSDIDVLAGADLSAKQFQAVVLNTDGSVVSPSGAGAAILGILQNKPTSGQGAMVRVLGPSKVLAAGTITAGDLLQFGTNGKATTNATTKVAGGIALAPAVSGDTFTAFIFPNIYPAP